MYISGIMCIIVYNENVKNELIFWSMTVHQGTNG